jgi:hypothetical protein
LGKLCALLLLPCAAFAQHPLLWHDPGRIEYLDFAGGSGGRGGAPRGPFRFIEKDGSGTSPKVIVRDMSGRIWAVKWGPEVKAENFASRLVWAMGYYTEPVYFVRAGHIRGIESRGRVDKYISEAGRFRDARFELRSGAGRFLREHDWTWEQNPFVGTREMNGLKVLIMLVSNWDNKDARDNGSNTGILQRGAGPDRQWRYLITDWGGSMGKWGNFFTREKWDCEGFRDQTPDFIDKVENRTVKFGFSGKHGNNFKQGIEAADVRWLLQYLGRVSDAQMRAALKASGASTHEVRCFTQALRARINQLKQVARVSSGAHRS